MSKKYLKVSNVGSYDNDSQIVSRPWYDVGTGL